MEGLKIFADLLQSKIDHNNPHRLFSVVLLAACVLLILLLGVSAAMQS
jgi:hypothetical protein